MGAVKIISLIDEQVQTSDIDFVQSASSPGIVDSSINLNQVDEQPLDETGSVSITYDYEYQCQPYSSSLTLFESIYEYYSTKDKAFYYQGDKPENWQQLYYQNFLESKNDLEIINTLISAVSDKSRARGDELVIVLTNLVQNLTYDCDKLFSIDYRDGQGYDTKFPYETLYTQQGVCEDSSILLGKILQALDYGAAYLVYDQSNHMAIGLQCPVGASTYVANGIGYCYVETTAPSRIGVKPANIGGNIFVEDPQIYPISEGKSFNRMSSLADEINLDVSIYGDQILQLSGCEEISLFKDFRDREDGLDLTSLEIDKLEFELEEADLVYQEELQQYKSMGCEGSLPKDQYDRCMAQGDVVNQAAEIIDKIYEEYKQTFDQYHSDYDQYAFVFNAYNALMQNANQGCAVVYTSGSSMQEEMDSPEQ